MKITRPRFFFLLFLAAFCSAYLAFGATLSKDEVDALKDIAKTLGKKDWDFSVDPCSGENNWISSSIQDRGGSKNNVICDCSYASGTVCHVTNILLKRQSLPGTLPPEIVRLPYLQEIDLTRNYLSGGIPKAWGSLNLINISVVGNRLTDSIPNEIANISTLQIFAVEANQLSGNLPPGLGNLPQIQKLHFSSNNFTGEIPPTYAKLTSLQELRISDNQFSGKIPDFIQSWTSLKKLVIEGSGLSGPIPSGISLLQNLTDLRISDLSGSEFSPFPQHLNNPSLKHLVLRSCNINGTLPTYLGTMTTLKTIDLSFNKLSGPIPSTYEGIIKKVDIYLTGNLLTGPVPVWTKTAKNLDISYNNFSIESQGSQTCQDGNMNLFSSSFMPDDLGRVSCLRSFECPKNSYSLHINCGGRMATVNESIYDDDSGEAGRARFVHIGERNWGFSSTGNFMESNEKGNHYTTSNESKLSITNAELYMTARVSPISLTYYGFCLVNGNYTVNLHFAEIMFANNQTYSSLGRRLFDVYIQGKLVMKNFNIAEEAGGVGKAVIKPFRTAVTNTTLEIRLYWAGKGTTVIPERSVYGPLISAISAKSDNEPPSENGNSISPGAVVGIVAAVAIIVILVFGILWWKGCLGKKNSLAKDIKGLDLQMGLFTLRQIKVATNNFNISNKIGEGGFGPVYKGILSDKTIIAVKQLSSKSNQGNREFLNEIGMISALQNPYLVKLYGCCVEGDQLLLVYEYLENNSLARALFGPEEHQIKLDWQTRHRICVGIARGLAYLHEESRLKVVHRDIKATNVLLDKDLNPKISDFGLARLHEEENTHISTRIAGTYGYMAPEYAMHGYLTDKADVYSFGIVALEIISGKNNSTHQQKEEALYLVDWAHMLKEKDNLMELVDRRLGSDFNKEDVTVMINVALLCTNVSPTLRPAMSSVVSMLEGKTIVQETVLESSEVLNEKKMETMRQYYQDLCISKDGPWTASSTSAIDLYPMLMDSSYLEGRN
ncbi:hypothetical protein RIF29_38939 [Crotalaria pallida]|uniref:non-specific serine/threonine protein kinase n=1 Tax=Crotalaria pallida TaxID=3830 RepID=A0AAN9E225_CROPI